MEQYLEIVGYFGTPNKVAEHFGIKVQSVYSWKEGIPEQRLREFNLIKKCEVKNVSRQIDKQAELRQGS